MVFGSPPDPAARRRPGIAAMVVPARWLVFEAAEALHFLFDCHTRPERSREFVWTLLP